jgi:hypothetical protein
VRERQANHGDGGGTVTVLMLVAVLVLVDVLVLVLVLGSVVDGVVVLGEELGVMVVVSVVVDVDGDVVVVVLDRDVEVFGLICPLVLEFDPPKIRKMTVAKRNPPIAPYITSAHRLRYHGVTGPSAPGGWPMGINSVGCSPGSGGGS